MSGNPRRRRDSSATGSVLREMLGDLFDFVGSRVQDAAPHCSYCGKIAVPLQCPCGGFGCQEHGYFNIPLARAICPQCAASLGAQVAPADEEEEDESAPPPRPRRPRPRERLRPDATEIAWELIGLDAKTATANAVNRAVRQAAKACHPDLHPGDAAAEKRFKALQRAKGICLADLVEREER